MNEQPGLSVSVEKLEGHKVRLEVTVDQSDVARAYEQAYRRLAGRVNVPGFRRGKTPRPVLERYVGAQALKEEALDIVLPPSYSRALDQKDLDPIDSPELDVVTFEEGSPLVFKATVEVKPEVILGKYKGLGLSVPPKAVDPSEVERQLEAVRERRAELEPTEPGTAVEDGLFAVVDYHGTVDGKPFPGGDTEGALVQAGAGQLEAPFEEAIKGAKAGDERECTLTFGDDHPTPELRGKEAKIKIKVREVKRKKLPPLTDELAREVAGVDVAGLRERIEKSLAERNKREAKEELARQVVLKVTDEAKVDVPETLVKRRMDRMTRDMDERLQRQGMSLDKYLELVNLEREKWDTDLRDRAEHQVKKDLVLEAVAKREKIEATEPEVEFEIARIAAAYQQKPDKVRAMFRESPDRLEALKAGIISDKTVQYLVKENEVPLPGEEDKAPAGAAEEAPDAARELGVAPEEGTVKRGDRE